MPEVHHSIRVGDIKPYIAWWNENVRVSHLVVRVVSIRNLPASIVVSGKTVITKAERKALNQWQNMSVTNQPQGIDMVEDNDSDRHTYLTSGEVIAEQTEPAVEDYTKEQK